MKTHYYIDDILDICNCKHLTVDEIYIELSSKFDDVGRSSVYRNVEELVSKWKLKKLIGVWKKAYFEKAWNEHIHLIDKNTWEIKDYCISCVDNINLPKNFKVDSMDLKVYWEFS